MPITPEEMKRIIDHMNDDHGDALVRYAHAFSNRQDVTTAQMIDLTETEIVLALQNDERLAIPLTSPVQTAKDVHLVLVEMAKEAHSILADKVE